MESVATIDNVNLLSMFKSYLNTQTKMYSELLRINGKVDIHTQNI